MIVVLPVCRPDFHLAMKWLKWARALDGDPDFQVVDEQPIDWLVVYIARSVEKPLVDQLRAIVSDWPGVKIEINPEDYEHPELGYAAMANQMFRTALEMTERLYPGRPTLWCEPDCIPMRPGWPVDIEQEYYDCQSPFMGDFHAPGPIPHMTGNAVYPPDWRIKAPSIALLPGPRPEQGWDTQCAAETLPQSHRSSTIQQMWIAPKFNESNIKLIHPDTALFHRCKDGSLIDVLAKRFNLPPIMLDRPLCPTSPATARWEAAHKSGVSILIVSCRRDIEMLEYCLKSIRKFCRGFAEVVVAVPANDAPFFHKVVRDGVKLTTFIEPGNKGMLQHMIIKCRADDICPSAEFVLHVDSDLLFWKPTTPDDFVRDGRCLIVREDYDLIRPRNPNRLIWADCVEKATGVRPEYDYMVRHPQVYPIGLYAQLRSTVEHHTETPFEDYVLSCENGWPQGFAEFPALGTIGMKDMPELFSVVDYDFVKDCLDCGVDTINHQYIYRPDRDSLVEGWTHGGLGRYKQDWDKFLRGELPKFYVK